MNKVAINRHMKRENIPASVHEELARTYLKLSDRNNSRKKRLGAALPWVIAVSALVLAMAVLVSKSNIDVKIRIVGEVPSIKSASGDSPIAGSGGDRGLLLAKGAEANRDMVKSITFMGDAKPYSRVTENEIVLCNSKGSGWAGYCIELKEPIDLGVFDIMYSAKGDKGGEYLSVSLLDAGNRSYMVEREGLAKLTREWKSYRIDFTPVKNAIDLTNITAIRFEFGSLTAGNSPVAAIYLKDIYATKNKRMR